MAPQITLEEPSVAASLIELERLGFSLDVLLASMDRDISSLAPQILTPIQALKLKIALRNKKREQSELDLYNRLLRFVGRVQVCFRDGKVQDGNAVLIWTQGFALTALHILTQEEEGAAEEDRDKGKQKEESSNVHKRKRKSLPEIQVTFPNTSDGLLQYKAVLVHSSDKDDLALLRAKDPLPPRFETVHTLRCWPPYLPQERDRVLLLSFPAGKGEEERLSHKPSADKDCPWYAEGLVTCVDAPKGQAFADYTSFGGASGALLVHPLPAEESYVPAIHLGTYHESVELPVWNRSQLGNLNESLGQKACNGYFSLNVGAFIESYFQPDGAVGKVSPKYLHHQVALRTRKTPKEKKDEAVEELDLFGPWPGLDDCADA